MADDILPSPLSSYGWIRRPVRHTAAGDDVSNDASFAYLCIEFDDIRREHGRDGGEGVK